MVASLTKKANPHQVTRTMLKCLKNTSNCSKLKLTTWMKKVKKTWQWTQDQSISKWTKCDKMTRLTKEATTSWTPTSTRQNSLPTKTKTLLKFWTNLVINSLHARQRENVQTAHTQLEDFRKDILCSKIRLVMDNLQLCKVTTTSVVNSSNFWTQRTSSSRRRWCLSFRKKKSLERIKC